MPRCYLPRHALAPRARPLPCPLRFAAAGDADSVPAFTRTLGAPPELGTLSPVFGTGEPRLDVPRSAPFDLTWSGRGPGVVTIYVAQSDTARVRSISCEAPASAGTLRIASQLLGLLSPGDSTIFIGRQNHVAFVSASVAVSVSVGVTGAARPVRFP